MHRGISFSPWTGKQLIAALFLLFLMPLESYGVTIDFESVSDLLGVGVPVSNQFGNQGVLFSDATALAAGTMLNVADFPPRSGDTLLSNIGPISRAAINAPQESFALDDLRDTTPLSSNHHVSASAPWSLLLLGSFLIVCRISLDALLTRRTKRSSKKTRVC